MASRPKPQKEGSECLVAEKGAGEKLPALLIFKERGGQWGPRVGKSLTAPENVRVVATNNGCMAHEMYHW